jgi:hypothetical protein
MNSSPDEFDAALAARFRQEFVHLPADPFVAATARRIAAARRRATYLKHASQAAGVIALILGSHWLIVASTIASTKLDAWFVTGIDWLVTPLGTVGVLLAGIGVLTALRWRSRGFRVLP